MRAKPMKGYCVYLNRESEDLSLEHVIPLSLGGHDSFSIYADRDVNNGRASKVDSDIANDFLIMIHRRNHKAVGHSKTQPVPMIKDARLESGELVSLKFHKDRMEAFDVRKRAPISNADFSGKKISDMRIKLNIQADIRFTAKTALAACYFIYGATFLEHANHDDLRNILMAPTLEEINPPVFIFSRFGDEDQKNDLTRALLVRATEFESSTCIISMHHIDGIGFSVAVLGQYLGTIRFSADGRRFPNSGQYDLGHVLSIRDGIVTRRSLREHLAILENSLHAAE